MLYQRIFPSLHIHFYNFKGNPIPYLPHNPKNTYWVWLRCFPLSSTNALLCWNVVCLPLILETPIISWTRIKQESIWLWILTECRRRSWTVFSFLKQRQHMFVILKLLFWGLSRVGILPHTSSQTKKATFMEALYSVGCDQDILSSANILLMMSCVGMKLWILMVSYMGMKLSVACMLWIINQ